MAARTLALAGRTVDDREMSVLAEGLRVADAAAVWRAIGAVRMEGALAPGFAAELAVGLTRLPLAIVEQPGEVVWATDVAIAPERDPQLFEPLFRVARLVGGALPALGGAIAGRDVVAAVPDAVTVVAYRKGSWTDAALAGPEGAIVCTIAITGGDWPRAWGGHDERLAPDGATAWCVPAVAGAIELAGVGAGRRVEVVRRHVERLELRVLLVPEAR